MDAPGYVIVVSIPRVFPTLNCALSRSGHWHYLPLMSLQLILSLPWPVPSLQHVHLGVKADDLPPGSLDCHYAHVLDWNLPIDAPGNVIVVSIPSVLDPTLAPAGRHCVHAYTAGNEPYAIWEGLKEGTEEVRISSLTWCYREVYTTCCPFVDPRQAMSSASSACQ